MTRAEASSRSRAPDAEPRPERASDAGDPHDSSRLSHVVAEAFAEHGPLARVFTGYEPRPGQQRMADTVATVVAQGGTLLAEAGTGTGKTLAYLIPAILSGHRTLVSTGTKNLQEQIFFKDLPALREALGLRFTATLMKGRGNYLCLHRWEQYRDGVESNTSAGGRLIETGDRVLLPMLEQWAKATRTGDRAELRDLPEDVPVWKQIAADVETCLGADCPRHSECFVTLMRQRAASSDVVIVNHHLLCADAAVRQGEYGEVIPSCPTLVVDEAHQLEEVATQYFGLSFSSFRVDDLVRDGEHTIAASARSAQSTGGSGDGGGQAQGIARALHRVAEHARAFFAGLDTWRALPTAPRDSRVRYGPDSLAESVEAGLALAGALEGLEGTLALTPPSSDRGLGGAVETEQASDLAETAASLQRRAGELGRDLRRLLRADDEQFVYYLETRGRGVYLRASPIDVSSVVRDVLFDRYRAVVLASATLTVGGTFEYARGRLGVRHAHELSVPSEFDYVHQALLYLPRRMPPPKSPAFANAAARETIELLKRSRGRAFVLFTSYAMLRAVQGFVEMALPYPVLVQGTAPRSRLIELFRVTPNAVLLATASFWQGVDVAGDALSCVIVDKLPFASPGDPITAARIDAIAARGGNAFAEYQVPLAVLALQQGLGRLIRHRSDRGVLAVLDPRIRTMGYGRTFLASLPPAPVTHDLDAVAQFFR